MRAKFVNRDSAFYGMTGDVEPTEGDPSMSVEASFNPDEEPNSEKIGWIWCRIWELEILK